ncbi:MAG TPA: pyruvate kinase [Actinocrinis sp.]|jgi:pyruvate kinase|uniref:pyruvate kinase n=1 Tax=Actinocrinis sp. TaxID=1920516 RepID=UPI002DDD6838|nr:pyruvate kinase [Actinocrinis sp.]HEV3172371.1 pyruvate kinase [Actinocrinis sp.]
MRRAKIVCTLGPSAGSPEQLKALVAAGLDIGRLNLSHGSYAEHEERYFNLRRAADEAGRAVGILVDLQGPKIRLGRFADGPHVLERGDEFIITTEDVPGDRHICSTTYKGLAGDCHPGDRILIDDGRVALDVVRVDGPEVVCVTVEGGKVSNNKGINLPGVAVSVPAMSEKDVADLRWALGENEAGLRADMIALSFVRSGKDIDGVHAVMDELGVRLPVIAKVEKPQAVENLDEVVDAFDGIMVARGDLGVEMPLEQVPLVQKRLITMCRRMAKPVIVATQMLDSMISASRPTRAEASDVANAIFDGADAVMLSAETSVGDFPVETVQTMAKIICAVEEEVLKKGLPQAISKPRTKGGAVARAAAELGDYLSASFLVAFTKSGDTARRLSRYRSPIPMLAFTPEPIVRSQLALTWGVETFIGDEVGSTDEMVMQVDQALLKLGRCQPGELIIIIAGSPPGIPGSTNAVRVHRVGDAVTGAAPAYRLQQHSS